MGNSFVSQVIKYTIGWESDRKKPQILLEMEPMALPGFPRVPQVLPIYVFFAYSCAMGN